MGVHLIVLIGGICPGSAFCWDLSSLSNKYFAHKVTLMVTWGVNVLPSSNPVTSFSCLVLKAMDNNFPLGNDSFLYSHILGEKARGLLEPRNLRSVWAT